MKIIDYRVVSSNIGEPYRLNCQIKDLIDKGYILHGPLVGTHTYIAQAMVKYEKPTPTVAVKINPPKQTNEIHWGDFIESDRI